MPNDFLDDDQDDDLETEQAGDSTTIKTLRSKLNAYKKQLKEQAPELEELRTFKSTYAVQERERTVLETAQGMGLDERTAKLYLKANPEGEVTDKAIASFALEYGLATEDVLPQPEKKVTSFKPVTVGGTNPVYDKISREDWQKKRFSDPEGYLEDFKEGRVEELSERKGPRGSSPMANQESESGRPRAGNPQEGQGRVVWDASGS